MVVEVVGSRQFYNLKILDIIEKHLSNKLIIEKLDSVLKRLGISENVTDLSEAKISNKESLENIRKFFNDYYDMRFLQGLINLGYVADSLREWNEESSVTYEKIKDYE